MCTEHTQYGVVERKIAHSVRLTQEQTEWLDEQDEPKAELIREAVDRIREDDDAEIMTDGGADRHYQECAIPECSTRVPRSVGICDGCQGTRGDER